jgi:hypothetical protein
VSIANEAAQGRATDYELHVDNQITITQERMDAIAEQYAQAMADADYTKAAQLQKDSNRLGGQLAVFERDKAVAKQNRERRQARPAQPAQPAAQQPAAVADPREAVIAGRSPRTQVFLRKHPELMRVDGTFKRAAIEAHESALDEGFPLDSDAYFEHIEKMIKPTSPAAEAAQQNGQPSYAAPVTRGATPGTSPLAPGTFRMSRHQQELARDAGVTDAEWANAYLKSVKEGKVTPFN